jgi:hypothetical protein
MIDFLQFFIFNACGVNLPCKELGAVIHACDIDHSQEEHCTDDLADAVTSIAADKHLQNIIEQNIRKTAHQR